MADAIDSKSIARKGVWVRVPPPAPKIKAAFVAVLIFGCGTRKPERAWLARRGRERAEHGATCDRVPPPAQKYNALSLMDRA